MGEGKSNEDILLDLCRENGFSRLDLMKVKKALDLAKEHLSAKKRLAGDSYYDHVVRVAEILLQSKANQNTILSAIVNETMSSGTEKQIAEMFGQDVLQLSKGVAEIKIIKTRSNKLEAEALRKVILATCKDIRIIVIKLANKLDNLRQLRFLPKERQITVAEEVLEFYAPLAYRLGIENMRTELENLAFAVVNPKKYQEIVNYFKESQEEREKNSQEAVARISEAVKDLPVIKIKGRSKHVYSIYRKMTKRGVPLDEQLDLFGARIIVPEIKDCYSVLGKLHELFIPVEGTLKDYIAKPKPNFYRSIHTAIILPNKKIVEVQIRTKEMDEFAEEGVAAHWKYKGIESDQEFEKKMSWLKGVLDLQKDNAKEFLESAKVDVFGDRIGCYTPKGEIKELPEGAAILDFAYLIHEEVGNHAIGARVNGKFVPLKHRLQQGDVVEIVTSKSQRPRMNWLKMVKSAKTRQKIRKYLTEHEKLPAFFYRTPKPLVTDEQGVLVESKEFPKALCVLARCCDPLPGDAITGIITKRRVISVHHQECRLALKEEGRWIKVNWKNEFSQKILFHVIAEERSGLLADVLHTIAKVGFEIKEAKAKMLSKDVECSFLLVPQEMKNVQEMMARVNKVKGIRKMYFE
ncbi:MAG TPA: HD domain-containing protein [Candidatus Nanoarchaeia archaeon]|nr:HD domain-containing protein [Candidatus Nanoarchaeia archaeon]